MEPARILLHLSTLVFLAGVVPVVAALRSGNWRKYQWQWLTMLLGFALQTGAIYFRGHEVHQCPMKSMSDILVFIAWSVVLLYFLVGSTYRMSLMGFFTAPLVALMQGLATAIPNAFPLYTSKTKIDPYVEMHVALSLIAYAAFAIACITGIMYLLQERFLKRHKIGGLFYQLPPIQGMAKVIERIIWLGLLLLSVGLAFSFKLDTPVTSPKLVIAWIVWVLYAVIALLIWRQVLSPRQIAWLASVGFLVPFITLRLVTTHA